MGLKHSDGAPFRADDRGEGVPYGGGRWASAGALTELLDLYLLQLYPVVPHREIGGSVRWQSGFAHLVSMRASSRRAVEVTESFKAHREEGKNPPRRCSAHWSPPCAARELVSRVVAGRGHCRWGTGSCWSLRTGRRTSPCSSSHPGSGCRSRQRAASSTILGRCSDYKPRTRLRKDTALIVDGTLVPPVTTRSPSSRRITGTRPIIRSSSMPTPNWSSLSAGNGRLTPTSQRSRRSIRRFVGGKCSTV